MQAAMESCVAKTALSGVMGFALGGAFGLFMSSVCNPTNNAWTKSYSEILWPLGLGLLIRCRLL